MISTNFGLYLLGKNLLDREQVLNTVNSRNHRRITPELLVFDAGVMSELQIKEVLDEQVLTGKTFSEISYHRGYLTFETMEELLGEEIKASLKMSQAAIDKEYLTLDQWFSVIAEYKRECEITPEQFEGFQSVNYRMIARVLLDFSSLGDMADFYYDYVASFLRNTVRLLDEEPVVYENFPTNSIDMNQLPDECWAVTQSIELDGKPMRTVFALDEKAMTDVAGKFNKEELSGMDELVIDSIKEFFNLSNGILAVNLSNSGMEANMLPPVVHKKKIQSIACGQVIPIGLADSKIYLFLDLSDFDGYEWCRF